MDTAQEALFRVMLNHGWFTESDGDVESPTGYFGYVVNGASELADIRREFADVITAYGDPADNEITGVYSACIDSNGSIYIHRHGDYVRTNTAVLGIEPTMPVRHAMLTFANRQAEYTEWADSE